MTDVPEDIRENAKEIVQRGGGPTMPWGCDCFVGFSSRERLADWIAQALLSERLAQKERDAKIAEGNDHFPEEGDYIAGLVRQS